MSSIPWGLKQSYLNLSCGQRIDLRQAYYRSNSTVLYIGHPISKILAKTLSNEQLLDLTGYTVFLATATYFSHWEGSEIHSILGQVQSSFEDTQKQLVWGEVRRGTETNLEERDMEMIGFY